MNRIILTVTLTLAILTPTVASACSDHARKPVKCSSCTNINGTHQVDLQMRLLKPDATGTALIPVDDGRQFARHRAARSPHRC